MEKQVPVQIGGVVLDQLERVRASGQANMVSRREVMRVANHCGHSELVVFAEEHKRDWMDVLQVFGEWKKGREIADE